MIRSKLYRRAPLPPKGGIIYICFDTTCSVDKTINEGKMPLAISRARQSAFYRSYLRKGGIGLSGLDAPEAGHGKGWASEGPLMHSLGPAIGSCVLLSIGKPIVRLEIREKDFSISARKRAFLTTRQ
jgi:hypothetical protein